jgi:SPX domain protein involved in polyphosphate accumulation
MKFGRNYWTCQVPEWADAYIDYDALKAEVKFNGG